MNLKSYTFFFLKCGLSHNGFVDSLKFSAHQNQHLLSDIFRVLK